MLKSSEAPRNFGVALVVLGIAMLVVGIGYHVSFMDGLRRERAAMKADGLIHAESQFPVSLTLMVALLLLDRPLRDREHGVRRRAVRLRRRVAKSKATVARNGR